MTSSWQILYRWYVLHLTPQASPSIQYSSVKSSPSIQYSSVKSILAKHINDSIFIIDMLNIICQNNALSHCNSCQKCDMLFLHSNFIAILELCTSFFNCWMMIQLSGQNLRFRIYVFSQIEKDICVSYL